MRAKRMTIFMGESDRWRHQPLYFAILQRLKAAGCAGGTVTQGIAGFGANSHIHTSTILRPAADEALVDLPRTVDVELRFRTRSRFDFTDLVRGTTRSPVEWVFDALRPPAGATSRGHAARAKEAG